MILRGGIAGSADEGDGSSFIFDVIPYHFAGCYNGYDEDDPDNFYSVYREVFEQIFQGEKDGFLSEGNIDTDKMTNSSLGEVEFGDSRSSWKDVSAFYCTWEGFTSSLSFAWEDMYHLHDIKEAPNRRIRRLMDDENTKKRKAAKKARVEEVTSLLRFVKNRDPRVMAQREKNLRERRTKEEERVKEQARRKQAHQDMKREWHAEQESRLAEQEQNDLDAGRIRLADLDDGYDYGGGKRRNRKGRRRRKRRRMRRMCRMCRSKRGSWATTMTRMTTATWLKKYPKMIHLPMEKVRTERTLLPKRKSQTHGGASAVEKISRARPSSR